MNKKITAPVGYFRKVGSELQMEQMAIAVQDCTVSGDTTVAARQFHESATVYAIGPRFFASVSIQLSPYDRPCQVDRDEAGILLPLAAAEEFHAALGEAIKAARLH